MAAPVRVALLGCGVVGTEVARQLFARRAELAERTGAPLELVGIGVRRAGRRRHADLDPALFTTDAAGLVERADVVVEVIGGIEPARTLLLGAMAAGASVVTANKALLAEAGPELHEAAAKAGVDLFFEAAVAGAIPIVRPLRESLTGDRVHRVLGIVNGTTNYVLDQMDAHGTGFAEALESAQALGYAEPDPTADVEGFDAAAKAALLATLAFHTTVAAADVHREGITGVTAADVASAREAGAVVKLLAIAEVQDGGEDGGDGGTDGGGDDTDGSADGSADGVQVRVHPALIPREHPLAMVRGAYNAVYVEAEAAGQLMFYGAGAGGTPTAGAVLGDVVTVARHRLDGSRGARVDGARRLAVLPMGQARTRYHVRLDVVDRPGVLASVAAVFAEHGVSIETVRQTQPTADRGQAAGKAVLVVVTHTATDAALSATVEALEGLDAVDAVVSVLRVEGE